MQMYLLNPQQQPEGSCEIRSVCPFILCLLGCLLVIGSLGFSEFWHGTRKPYQVVPPRFFEKTVFAPKSWEKGQSGLWTPKLTVSQERTDVTN